MYPILFVVDFVELVGLLYPILFDDCDEGAMWCMMIPLDVLGCLLLYL